MTDNRCYIVKYDENTHHKDNLVNLINYSSYESKKYLIIFIQYE